MKKLQKIALETLLYQYAFRFGDNKKHGVSSRVHREIVDYYYEHDPEPDFDKEPVSFPPINDFIYRRKRDGLSPENTDLITDFLVHKRYLDRQWFEELEEVEDRIDTLRRERCEKPVVPDLEGLYLFEGYAFTEAMIAYFLLHQTKSGATSAKFVERVYRRNVTIRERGATFFSRLENAQADFTQSCIGFVYPNASDFSVELYEDIEAESQSLALRMGQLVVRQTPDTVDLSVTLFEDNLVRIYKKYTQPADDKSKNTYLLNNKHKNNIIKSSRFFDRRNNRSFMEPVFFEERELDFCELDFQLLRAAEDGDAIAMVKFIAEGANINVCDPETGKTALHLATRSLSPIAACVLVPKEYAAIPNYDTIMANLYEAIEAEGIGPLEEIDFKLRSAQQKLNPLYMDRDHEFSSMESGFHERMNPYLAGELKDPLIETRHDMELIVGACISKRLREQGILPVLPKMPLDERLQIIQEYRSPIVTTPEPPVI